LTHRPGQILDGKYEILGRLGSGGMGELYRVRHAHLGDVRVVKILRQDLAADPAAAQRFLQEARTSTSIKHPNVATLYDFSKLPDGSFYMVWEHIEGEDVGKRLRERGPFPVPLALDLGVQALRGLEAIHAAGVIHRDVSPDNLMITRTAKGQPLIKIIDLGLAKNLADSQHELTQAGMFLGKLRYCSPEQAGMLKSGEVLDHRSDLYSFAAVLYEMVCGLPPFDSESAHGFVLKRLSEDPQPLVGRNPALNVPAELDRVVRRGLERDRDARFPDAPSFAQALQRVAEALRGAATQEVALPAKPGGAPAGKPLAVRGAAPAAPARPGAGADAAAARKRPGDADMDELLSAVRAAVVAPPSRRAETSRSDLSRSERDELMAQIDRAARRAE
jgi:serine/threonine-protein kinase